MNDKAKIAALRAALNECVHTEGIAFRRRIAEPALTLTADDAEQAPELCVVEGSEGRALCQGSCAESGICTWKAAPIAAEPAPKPWQDRMAAHFGQGKSVQCHPASHFMQQEIDEWRKK